MTFPNEIEKTKAEIKVLEAKLSLLEEMEKHQKSPAEEAFKRFFGRYPVTDIADTCWDGHSWAHFEAGYHSAKEDYKYQPTPQTPESNEWRTAALNFGENLCDIGPYGYYAMTADEWLEWAKSAFEKIVSEWLQLMHKEKSKKIMNDVKDLQEKDWTYKVTDEKGETNPYKQYLNNVDNEEYLYKKYTPEETEKSLKDAMKQAKAQGVFDEAEPETLKQLLKKWELDFSANWAKNRTCEVYEEEVERFIQTFIEWMPDAIVTDIGRSELWNGGYNAYHRILMGRIK